jgi:Ca-activated chloride channel family protein
MDHLLTYKLRVHTIPPVDVDNIKLTVGKHTIIAANTPQGTLILKTKDGHQYRDIQYIVRKAGDEKTLNMQDMYREEKYLAGKYDIEVPVLPRIYLNNVEIKQSQTTTIEIPRPGILTLIKAATGFGSIYHRISNKKEEWVCNIDSKVKNESLILQPGKYRVTFRAQNAKLTIYTVNKTFEIKSGSSIALQLY